MEVFFDHLLGEGDYEVENYLVLSPKNKTANLVGGVAVLPIYEGKIALINIYRHPIDCWSWEIPRGFLEPGEENELSVIRELEEETGLTCDKNKLDSLGVFAPDGGSSSSRIEIFVATECQMNRPYFSNELGHGEMRFFDEDQILSMANDSFIEDPSTIIAIYRYLTKIRMKL
jgi:ADP-ribose pyrophosphatase YjhB (NUDIX family)